MRKYIAVGLLPIALFALGQMPVLAWVLEQPPGLARTIALLSHVIAGVVVAWIAATQLVR